jgi:hypothetical protein
MPLFNHMAAAGMLGKELAGNHNKDIDARNNSLRRNRINAKDGQIELNPSERAERLKYQRAWFSREVTKKYNDLINRPADHPTPVPEYVRKSLMDQYEQHNERFKDMQETATANSQIAEMEAKVGNPGEIMVIESDENVIAENIAQNQSMIDYLDRQAKNLEVANEIAELTRSVSKQYEGCRNELKKTSESEEELAKLEGTQAEYDKILADIEKSNDQLTISNLVKVRDFLNDRQKDLEDYHQSRNLKKSLGKKSD